MMYLDNNEILKNIKKGAMIGLIAPFLLIVFALVLFQNPDNFISVAVSLFGYGAIFLSVINTLLYFKLTQEERPFSKKLTNSLLLFAFGVTSFFQNALFSQIICVLLGGYMVYQNAGQVTVSFLLRDYEKKIWPYLLVMSFVNIILGIVIIINPFPKAQFNLYLASLLVIGEGLLLLQNIFILWGVKYDKKDK